MQNERLADLECRPFGRRVVHRVIEIRATGHAVPSLPVRVVGGEVDTINRVHEQPTGGAIGPEPGCFRLDGPLPALAVLQTHGFSMGQRSRRHWDAAGEGETRSRDGGRGDHLELAGESICSPGGGMGQRASWRDATMASCGRLPAGADSIACFHQPPGRRTTPRCGSAVAPLSSCRPPCTTSRR